MKFNKSDRQSRIVAELRAAPSLRINELALRLDVSTETVRRDLAELDERGLVNRTYGGAMRPTAFEPALAEREKLMVEERERIAAAAVQLVEPNDILMIGGGAANCWLRWSEVERVASWLKGRRTRGSALIPRAALDPRFT